MKLWIEGNEIEAMPGETILELIKKLQLDGKSFTDRPIAAKVAGEVFNLNYIPVRQDAKLSERSSIRRAMAASNGIVQLIRYSDPVGRDVYARTVRFVLFMALYQLWPHVQVKTNFAIGKALFVEVRNTPEFNIEAFKLRVKHLVEQDIPLVRKRLSSAEAIERFAADGQTDKARLLSWRKENYFDVYYYGSFADYYYGELAPSTGYVQIWDILPADGGFVFLYPDDNGSKSDATYEKMPNFFQVCKEGERWCQLMECETVADLNELTCNGKIRELIRVNESLHEKNFSQVADMICQRGAKLVMLAGPSSSGKTTSANRLATQLRVHGKKLILMSLDDYYVDRDQILPDADGTLDLEHINTIDTALFREHVKKLFAGEKVSIPSYNFLKGKREWRGNQLEISEAAVIIVEGLHALNPSLLPQSVLKNMIFTLYVSPLIPLNLDNHNRIPSSLLRLLRRIVRDYEGRGASVQKTMSMWDSVRRGEKRWIFPFQEGADVIFNSSTLYELSVLKRHIYPLLTSVQPEDSCYEAVRSVVKILNYVLEADVDDEIPPTSIIREFIGGNSFYR